MARMFARAQDAATNADEPRITTVFPSPDPLSRLDTIGEPRTAAADVAQIIRDGTIHTVFQPLVWLQDRRVAGLEALTRGPADHPLGMPDALFAAARTAGLLGALDGLCVRSALHAARAHGVDAYAPLLVNVEASTLTPDGVRTIAAMRDGIAPRAKVVLEITEREIATDPAAVLAAAREARRVGLGVALDDVGADPASLALLPVLRPDVVKLDRQLIRGADRLRIAAVAAAVAAYAEATGAVVVAEGVEDDDDRAWAVTMGAHVGQGWLFGRPRALVELDTEVTPVGLLREPPIEPGDTPFSLVAHQGDVRVARKAELLVMSRHLERMAAAWHADAALVLASFQDELHVTERSARAYEAIAERSPLVVLFGAGVPTAPVPRAPAVRGEPLALDDPLRDEWNVVVLGPHYAGALLSRDLGDRGADHDRRFAFVMTHRRELVVHAARTLLARVGAR